MKSPVLWRLFPWYGVFHEEDHRFFAGQGPYAFLELKNSENPTFRPRLNLSHIDTFAFYLPEIFFNINLILILKY
jgi:hypothetical protein